MSSDDPHTVARRDALERLRGLSLNSAHAVDLVVRQNGQTRHVEADWLKYIPKIASTALTELRKQGLALPGSSGFAALPAMSPIPNDIARRNKLPKLPTLHRGGLNANTALGPDGGGIGGGGMPPGSKGYGIASRRG